MYLAYLKGAAEGESLLGYWSQNTASDVETGGVLEYHSGFGCKSFGTDAARSPEYDSGCLRVDARSNCAGGA